MGGGITKLNSNAFTLIELLAIIVILAIIAVITVPIILNIIENSRKGAATDSAYGYKDSVNKTYIAELQNHNKLKLNDTYTVTNGTLSEGNFGDEEITSLQVSVSGTIPSSGSLTYENNVLKSGYLVIGDYRVTFNSAGTVTTTKNTSSSSNEQSSSGSGQSGNNANEQITYTYSNYKYDDDTDEPEDWWSKYIRTNTSTGEKEACAVDVIEYGGTGDTVCIKRNSDNYYNNFGEYVFHPEDDENSEYYGYESLYTIDEITGYPAQVYEEVVSKGGSCEVGEDSYPNLYCSFGSAYICIEADGDMRVEDDGSAFCFLNADDQSCH